MLSPLLSNIYGHALDALFEKEAKHLGTYVRYADDIVILCRSEADAQRTYAWLQKRAQSLRLRLHPEKTRVVAMGNGRQGFDFLGFHRRMTWSHRYGKPLCFRWPAPRAMSAIRHQVKAITGPRYKLKRPLTDVVRELNPVIRGWGNYFRWGNSSKKFAQIDCYVQERLALFSSKKHGRRGRRWGTVHNTAWQSKLGVVRLSGTIRYV